MLNALVKTSGLVSLALEKAKVGRDTYYRWLKEDPTFLEAVDTVKERMKDFAEGKLYSLINKENVVAIIFYLKTKAKDRGYVERQEISHSGRITTYKSILITGGKHGEDTGIRSVGQANRSPAIPEGQGDK